MITGTRPNIQNREKDKETVAIRIFIVCDLMFNITNSMEPSPSSEANKQIPCVLWNRSFIIYVYSEQPATGPNQKNPVHTFTSYFLDIH
jgi:hypothetical protein